MFVYVIEYGRSVKISRKCLFFLSVFSSDKNGDDVQASWQVFCDIAILLLYCLLPLLPVACAALLSERNEYSHSISPVNQLYLTY